MTATTTAESGRTVGQYMFLAMACAAIALSAALGACTGKTSGTATSDTIALKPAPQFCTDSAMAFVEAQCRFGARTPMSTAHDSCCSWIAAEFRRLGAAVAFQNIVAEGYDSTIMHGTNIMASINPESIDRVLLSAHYDSRYWADNDPDAANHHLPVMAANDGASGVAVMLEMARAMTQMPISYGVDFVCFDLEDQGIPRWAETDEEPADPYSYWCLGSRKWAEQAYFGGYRARFAVNLDMVGGRNARFAMESYSLRFARPVVDMIWHVAHQIGYGDTFPLEEGGSVMDDHVSLYQYAHIPAIDIVPHVTGQRSSFGDTWHTVHDTPANIDASVMKAVGQVLLQVLYKDN